MLKLKNVNQIVFTNDARCHDCYRCVRVCPVNAIKMKNGQAQVEIDRCILCGTCIIECPQGAKSYRTDIEKVKKIISDFDNVAVSIAPSFPALFNEWERKRLPSVLRKLGFSYVSETAEAVASVAEQSMQSINRGKCSMSSSCPAFVNYIEKYDSKKIGMLIPVVSPMIAHAKRLKDKLGDETRVVFIGPCIAKKGEAERDEFLGLVDAVLTFEELQKWIDDEKVDMSLFEESQFDDMPDSKSRLFPLAGGFFNSTSQEANTFSATSLSACGFTAVEEALKSIDVSENKFLLEPLFCTSGCMNGPGIVSERPLYSRKVDIIEFNKSAPVKTAKEDLIDVDLSTKFCYNKKIIASEFTEQDIRRILEETGKGEPEDQLNCGACGYHSCREKAIAVLNGMAEKEMCIPHMKKLAEQRTDKIIESSPNGIIILDSQLRILHMNPAFRKFFKCSNSIVGKPVSYLMDPELFIEIREQDKGTLEKTINHENYNFTAHQLIYKLEPENQIVGVFVDITKKIASDEKFTKLKQQTIIQAQELLSHQVEMAQQIAKFLGESSAKGEILVENLLKYAQEENSNNDKNKKNWLWDIYTSK